MVVSEKTSYNLKTLHKVFAVSAILMLLATILVFLVDHRRPWKEIQRRSDRILLRAGRWQRAQQLADGDQGGVEPLDRLLTEKRSSYFNVDGWLPTPGKKWLELPIVDAFNSPRKVENLWHEELDQPLGSFGRVRRIDRCTTCHQLIQKTLPGSAAAAAFPTEFTFDLLLTLSGDIPPDIMDARRTGSSISRAVETITGMRLAPHGLMSSHEVAVAYVRPRSAAATSPRSIPQPNPREARRIRKQVLQTAESNLIPDRLAPGLQLGDVITAIDGQRLTAATDAQAGVLEKILDYAAAYAQAVQQGTEPPPPLRIAIRRGLPSPYASHPRLDLFVGSLSPHRLSEFACTVCHEGQGSATAFKWASHTPDSVTTADRWWRQYDWFDNPDWQYPMWPQRFIESACLKCHHQVVDLRLSKRFAEPPAPKVVRGDMLIRHFGCFGCHEINGFDEDHQPVGPDLRLEPNYSAVAAQLKGAEGTGYRHLTPRERKWIDQLILDPTDDATRHSILQMIRDDRRTMSAPAAESARSPVEQKAARFSEYTHQTLAPLLEDQSVPGQLRKVGPSLRFVAHKLDRTFLVDWIQNPSHFRPTTNMPDSFGQWRHLPAQVLERKIGKLERSLFAVQSKTGKNQREDGEQIKEKIRQLQRQLDETRLAAQKYEPVEILSMVAYLTERSQAFKPLTATPDIAAVDEVDDRQTPIQRGKIIFEERGCVACHAHQAFPDMEKYREVDALQQGPDLSETATKFDIQRNPAGASWLYSWIKQPTGFDPRTIMPDQFLTPVETVDADGRITSVTDPVADVVAFLLADEHGDWQPSEGLQLELGPEQETLLVDLTREHLGGLYSESVAARLARFGIAADELSTAKGAEVELAVDEREQKTRSDAAMNHKRLMYVGKKSLVRYGCFGCHDVPGLEDAKPIGPNLSEWGRQDASQLAFGHILQYVGPNDSTDDASVTNKQPPLASGKHVADDEIPPYYHAELADQSRIGFLFQKLTEPRSFDYRETENKSYLERLRMPQFPLTFEQREAIMTFVLGLVSDPPADTYVYSPDRNRQAIMDGQQVIDKYNCRSCHILELEKWQIAYPAGYFGEQDTLPTYPFVVDRFGVDQQAASLETNRLGLREAMIQGMPSTSNDGLPLVYDFEEFPIEEEPEETFDPQELIYAFDLWRPVLLDGDAYQVGEASLYIPAEQIQHRSHAVGGAVAKYLLPRVVRRQREVMVEAKGAEAWGWLPPALVNEGLMVQTDWLFNYLLDPYPIRPASSMRMPRFNMSPSEARQLVNYFAAVAQTRFPYQQQASQNPGSLARVARQYAEDLSEFTENPEQRAPQAAIDRYLDDALKMLTNENYCVTCHVIGDYHPTGLPQTLAPDLADIYRRFKSGYVRKWIARPAAIQPYTSMPINISYDPDAPFLGSGVPQELFHGTSIEQVEALVDLLMNFDAYARQRLSLSKKETE